MYLITGAGGNVGSQLVSQLSAAGHRVRAYVRDPAKIAPFGWDSQVEIAVGDYATPDAFADALEGVQGVFLMNIGDTDGFARLVSCIAERRVPRVVFLSTTMVDMAPDTMLARMHREKEDLIRAANLDARFLRPTGFMSNTYLWLPGIRAQGIVQNPMGEGRAAPIAPDDIAAVAAHALTGVAPTDTVMTLTGGETINVPEQVALVARALDRPLRCVDITTETAIENLVRAGVPQPAAASVAKSFEAVKAGRAGTTTDTVERVLGRKPLRFDEWLSAHIERFQ
ncbi:MAG TPA: NAD(P)H-binding protein [Trinickia sp.]|nr:NAD(P)H-binding protein [Trinickia sp.]